MRSHLFLLFGALLLLGLRPAPASRASLQITYVGNEGFLLRVGGEKILIDSLYRQGVRPYVVHPAQRLERMETALTPFDAIGLVLATHHHADHFDADSVARHLRSNPRATFVSTHQSGQALARAAPELEQRVRAQTPVAGKKLERTLGELGLTAMNMHHGRGNPAENLGFLIEVGGWKVLHVGDTQMSSAELAVYELDQEGIDVAFVPSWFFEDPDLVQALRQEIAPRHVVVMHLPPLSYGGGFIAAAGGWVAVFDRISSHFPEAKWFEAEMDSLTLD